MTGSRYVHKDRWIAVRADDCVTEDGVSVAPYYVLEYPDWVEIVALDADDNLLLVRQYRHGIADFSIELPAGGMDPSGADPCTAAARELLEETGCAGDMVWVGEARRNASTHANRGPYRPGAQRRAGRRAQERSHRTYRTVLGPCR